jgi:hypothetical protein
MDEKKKAEEMEVFKAKLNYLSWVLIFGGLFLMIVSYIILKMFLK